MGTLLAEKMQKLRLERHDKHDTAKGSGLTCDKVQCLSLFLVED